MKQEVKVSIIIPVYNTEKYLRECLDSVINQTLEDIEIICINDGSTDNSLEILREYEKKDKRIIVIDKENTGVEDSRNIGINLSKGEYLGFIDSDDYISQNYFEDLYDVALTYKSSIVMTDNVITIEVNKQYEKLRKTKNLPIIITKICDKGQILIESGILWNKIYKREFIINNKITNSTKFGKNTAGKDNYFTFLALFYAEKIIKISTPVYYYVQHSSSLVHNTSKTEFLKLKIYEAIENLLLEMKIPYNNKVRWMDIIKEREKLDFRYTYNKLENSLKEEFSKEARKYLKKNRLYSSSDVFNLQNVFSITNSEDKKHKVITVLGLKIKIRRLKKKITKRSKLNKICNLYTHGINKEKVNYEISMFEGLGVTEIKRNKKLIVSLTSFPDRMYDIHYCIYSLLNQTVKPDEIILWLADEQFVNKKISPKLLQFQNNGLTIKWCKDLKSYKKLIPALKEYPNDIIITADDDIYYPENWLEILYEEYLKNPEVIIAHRCHRANLDKCYNNWTKCITDSTTEYTNFFTGVGGVLYPPHCLYKDILREDLFIRLAPNADDIWFWAMAVLNRTKIKIPANAINTLTYTTPEREFRLYSEKILWAKNSEEEGGNTSKLKNILDYYPEIRDIINEKASII